jgi:hypothetical protein
MKLTASYLKRLIRESLEQMGEGDVIPGQFGGKPPVDQGKPASVTDISSRFQGGEDEMPEGAMWIKDVAEIVKILSSTTNGVLDAIAEVDEGLATKLDDHVGNIMPVVRDMIDQMEDEEIPADAYLDDPEHVSNVSTERSYEISGMEPEED